MYKSVIASEAKQSIYYYYVLLASPQKNQKV